MGSIPIVGTILVLVAQSVEQLTFNQWVGRSNRLGDTILTIYTRSLSGGIGRRAGLKILW